MRRALAAGLGAAVLALTACFARGPSTAGPGTPPPGPSTTPSVRYPLGLERYPVAARRPLPAVSGATLDGSHASAGRLRGHVVVLNVWASWCVPCHEESRVLAALSKGRRRTVRWLGMDENDEPGPARTLMRAAGFPAAASYPTIVDDGSRLKALAAWLPPALPGTLVVDAQGRVAARVVGAVWAGQLDPVLAELGASS